MVNKWFRDMRLKKQLVRIVGVSPDRRIPLEIDVRALARRGWLRIVEHSDGDYVLITKAGRIALGHV